MQYELTIRMTVKSRYGLERVCEVTKSVCHFGTVREAIGDALIGEDPRLLDVVVRRLAPPPATPIHGSFVPNA